MFATKAISLSQCIIHSRRHCGKAMARAQGKVGSGVVLLGGWIRIPSGLPLPESEDSLHRVSSPKKHVPKVYQVTTKHPVTAARRLNAYRLEWHG